MLIGSAVFSLLGELVNRAIFRKEVDLDEAALAGSPASAAGPLGLAPAAGRRS